MANANFTLGTSILGASILATKTASGLAGVFREVTLRFSNAENNVDLDLRGVEVHWTPTGVSAEEIA